MLIGEGRSETHGVVGRRARWRHVVVAIALLVVGGGAAGLYLSSSSVEVEVDGEVLRTRTFATDVAGVLDRLEVELGDADQLDPGPDTPVVDGLTVVVVRAKAVEVEVEGEVEGAPDRRVVAVVDTVADVLRAADLAELLDREARIDPAPDRPVADGDHIVVELPVTVTISVDGDQRVIETYADTVAAALSDAGVELGGWDQVEPEPGSELGPGATISVQRVEVTEDVIEVAIEHDERRRETDELPTGETRVATEGRDGLVRETYRVTIVDGEETRRELVREELVREPVERVVLVGVGPAPIREAQQLLTDLGYPAGSVDGVDGAQTRRGLCAWRRLEGLEVSRRALQPGELEALRASSGLPAAGASGRGVTVDRTCQTLYYRQDGHWRLVHHASTGADGLPASGSYTIQRTRPGWHTSSLYPAAQPNMYNSLYFHGAIAIHGSGQVPPYPASAGCVRVTPQAADQLFADLDVGDPVRVIGAY